MNASTPPLPQDLTSYLDTLNAPQRAAVETLDGPVLVLSGAGTGKTRVLITRIAHILLSHRAWPSEILAVTFTNKAAMEMRERISTLIQGPAEGFWLGTFHALCARMLRRHAELVGLTPSFTILGADDQLRLMKQISEAEGIDIKEKPPRMILSIIERWKDRGLTPDQVGQAERDRCIYPLYHLYQERLRTLNACDFGDLILHCLTLLRHHPEVLAQYRDRFKYILVDEYQDTNIAQYLWLRLLTPPTNNLCCVGDDDQSIYSWRGAEVGNILRFEQDFPGATIIRLEQNYRSTPHILGAASGLIAHNNSRLGKTLWTEQDAGEKVQVVGLWDGEQEARWVGATLESFHRRGIPLGDAAILVRAGFQTREFEECFLRIGIPYRVIGGLRFYERLEIRDALAYLRLVRSSQDDLAYERIINTPKRGIGDSTLRLIHEQAHIDQTNLVTATRALLRTDELKGKAKAALSIFMDQLERWQSLVDVLPPANLAEKVLDESGYTAMWRQDKSPDAPGRLENLKELVVAIGEFDNLQGFLEHVALVTENLTEGEGISHRDMVSLMTIHSAKGLEFPHVFLAGWEEGLFPHVKSLQEGGTSALEEERRLAYVALTRARHKATILHVSRRRIQGQWTDMRPSRFLHEIPREHLEESRQPMPAWRGGGRGEGLPHGLHLRHPTHPRALASPGASSAADVIDITPALTSKRVFHEKFGYGIIQSRDGDMVTVHFTHAGVKKVMASYLKESL